MSNQKIYTRTGDAGETALFGGGRVTKSHPRVEAYGDVDELNAVLGWAAAVTADGPTRDRLHVLQGDLFAVGAHLATPDDGAGRPRPWIPAIPEDRVAQMEAWIDEADAVLPPLRAFILPGGSAGAAALHLARTICRRAERRIVRLAHDEPIEPSILVLLNRMSDYLFTVARLENHKAGTADPIWDSGR
jgi:cob(I)alamin adenosyltransferase